MIDWLFRHRQTGEITVTQVPNVALWTFLGAVGLRLFLPADGALHQVLDVVAFGALMWWSVDEMARGVNPWRRFLGALGACFALAILVDIVR